MTASKKTTAAGIAALVAAIGNIITAYANGDISQADWGSLIPAIIAAIGLLFARDNSVTSEQAGAK